MSKPSIRWIVILAVSAVVATYGYCMHRIGAAMIGSFDVGYAAMRLLWAEEIDRYLVEGNDDRKAI